MRGVERLILGVGPPLSDGKRREGVHEEERAAHREYQDLGRIIQPELPPFHSGSRSGCQVAEDIGDRRRSQKGERHLFGIESEMGSECGHQRVRELVSLLVLQ